MDLIGILNACSPGTLPLDQPRQVKLARHADNRWDLGLLSRMGFFEEYQARQAREVFRGGEFLLSFMGEEGTRSRLIGVYAIGECHAGVPSWPEGYPFPEMGGGQQVHYDLHLLDEFDLLRDRLVIDWGKGTRSWVQNLRPKSVIEILPTGYVRDFPGYQDFVLEFAELERVVRNPDANKIWHRMLGAVAGVYLITDRSTGDQYVGSAYGKGGIIGRWTQYVQNGHGGNQRLRALLEKDPKRSHEFLFSILRTLPSTLTNREVIEVEQLYKAKLGSRAHGLNAN